MTRRQQRHARKGEALKIHPGRPWRQGRSTSSFLAALSLPLGHWPLLSGKTETWRCCPQGRHQSTWLWLHHRHQANPTQNQIPVQGVTSEPSRSFGVSRLWHPSSGPWSGYRAHPHRHRPLIQIQPTTTQRSGSAPAGNPRKAVALSAWWPRMVTGWTTPPADIPPSGDQRCLTPEHRVAAWFRIWIQTSMLSGSRQLWKPCSTWRSMTPPLLP
jgi:hypothetical protein